MDPSRLDAPFTLSPEAEIHFRYLLRYIAENVPETSDLIPVLCRGKIITTWTWRGASPLKEFSDEEFSIGYYRPDQVANWPRVRVAGAELAANNDTLEKASGLHLALTEATAGEPMSGRVIGRRY
jgi:hypothetical protein